MSEKVCAELGLVSKGAVTGGEMDRLSERKFDDMVETTTIFARSTPSRRHD